MDITLFHYPGACSRVPMNALEEIGVDYETNAVDIVNGQQKSPEYRAVNPKGKVPALRIGERVLTENAAILYHLSRHFPAARLLPAESGAFGINECLEDLVWCSAALHPMTRQVRVPMRFTTGATDGVRALGIEYYQPVLAKLSDRFSLGSWWYGGEWSIIDVYLCWNYSTAQVGGLDLSAHPNIAEHARRVRERPAYQRVLERERKDAEASGFQLAQLSP